MPTDTSEKGLESLVMRHMTGLEGFNVTAGGMAESPSPFGAKNDAVDGASDLGQEVENGDEEAVG